MILSFVFELTFVNFCFVSLCLFLLGHEKYLKTTIAGLTGSHPDFALIIINSLAGVTKMTKEHLGVVLALEIPLIVVVSKIDLVPENVAERTKKELFRILKSPAAKQQPIQIKDESDIELILHTENSKVCPVFFISSVTGLHIDLLNSYLSKLKPRYDWLLGSSSDPVSFTIDETFNVSGVGVVVSGTVQSGTIHNNSVLLLGPSGDNSFHQVLVKSIHCKRVPVDSVVAGSSCAISLRSVGKKKEQLKRQHLRRGMALVDPVLNPRSTRYFDCQVNILHHPSTIRLNYQCVIHLGMVRQTASLISIDRDCLRTGDRAICRFKFVLREEYIHTNQTFVFREGSTKGIGKITKVDFTAEEIAEIERNDTSRPQMKSVIQRQQSAITPPSTPPHKPVVHPSTSTFPSTSSSSSTVNHSHHDVKSHTLNKQQQQKSTHHGKNNTKQEEEKQHNATQQQHDATNKHDKAKGKK